MLKCLNPQTEWYNISMVKNKMKGEHNKITGDKK